MDVLTVSNFTGAGQLTPAVDILREGGVVAYPTDTVYGLGAQATIDDAVRRVFQVKRRPRQMALPLLLGDAGQLDTFAACVPPLARRLAEKFWPGALTLVLLKSALVSDLVSGGGNTVALRVPAHPLALALIHSLGSSLTGTSANISGMSVTLSAQEVIAQLGDDVDMVIDGGALGAGVPSTVLDLSGGTPAVRRIGAVSLAELERFAEVSLE
jgi:L-threonylcarbamoyladenylate synthase